MFVALRDLRHARGRFALVTVVVVMVALLVAFLSMLTGGLARASTSAITDLPADQLAFTTTSADAAPDVTSSRVTQQQWQEWAQEPGVTSAQPLGIATTRATAAGTTQAVTALGVAPESTLVPGPVPTADGVVITPGAAAELDLAVGEVVNLDGLELTVTAITDADPTYSHTPVVWTTLADWQRIGARGAGGQGEVATLVALTLEPGTDVSTGEAATGTVALSPSDARSAVSSFTAENTSLTTMQLFLVVISALVVGAFFSVWTISRTGDIAVMKALGASTRYLLRDAIGQAALLLVLGVAAGTGIAVAAGLALASVVPVQVTAGTAVLPALALVGVGLLGAVIAVARITRTDPHAALAAR